VGLRVAWLVDGRIWLEKRGRRIWSLLGIRIVRKRVFRGGFVNEREGGGRGGRLDRRIG
jgi:hypothetical protein